MRTFNSKNIYPHVPNPKINQIWENEHGKLVKIVKANKAGPSYNCEYENGETVSIGGAWFDGKTFRFIGVIY